MKYLRKIKLPKLNLKSFRKVNLPKVDPKWLYRIAGGLIIINLMFFFFVNLPSGKTPFNALQPTRITTDSSTATPLPTQVPTEPVPTATFSPVTMTNGASNLSQGTIVFSVVNNGYSNINGFQPGLPGYIRLTSHPWDDIDPSISPDGLKIAYSSKQNGYWNIYILDLTNGQSHPVTDSAEYDAHPVWSPDGSQLLIETYIDTYFQLQIVDLSTGSSIIEQLTAGDYSSYDANWSPDGQNIAYISNQSGSPAIWMVSITENQRQYFALPIDQTEEPAHPTFSPDGTKLAWSALKDGFRTIYVWDRTQSDQNPRSIGRGDQLAWGPDSQVILCSLRQPLNTYLTAYSLLYGNMVLPPFNLPGEVSGIDWHPGSPDWQQNSWVTEKQTMVDNPPYLVQVTPVVERGRFNIVQVTGLDLEYPYLHDMVDESFQALRNRLIFETGWDFLANIQSAFLPISQIPEPDQVQEWLYTGRGISINPVPLSVGWMHLIKETYGSETFWRVYIRPVFQDGSMGAPVHTQAWDINSRYNNDPAAYEQGGKLSGSEISGYWVDFTDYAHRFGWERLSALSNWVTYYSAARFNIFINNGGLSWKAAMLELYPKEIFQTPTLVTLPTATPTNTPKPRRTVAPTSTPIPTSTQTLRPTWTPLP